MKKLFLAMVLASLALFGVTAVAGATTPPITGPWTGGGTIALDGGLGGTTCVIDPAAGPNGTTISTITFVDCVGEAGDLHALVPWAVIWNADLVSGRIAVRASAAVLGATCLYAGNVPFRYTATGSRSATLTLDTGGTRVPRNSGIFICPSSVGVTGTISVAW